MRICFFVANLADGGAQRQCVALLNLLQRNPDLDVHLMLLGTGEHERDLDTSRHPSPHDGQDFASPAALIFSIRALRRINRTWSSRGCTRQTSGLMSRRA